MLRKLVVVALALALALAYGDDADARKARGKAKKPARKKKPTTAAGIPIPRSDAPLPDLVVPPIPPGAISFAAVGDIMMGSTFPEPRLPEDDGVSMLAEVAPILRIADVAFGNLEGPLVDDGISSKCRKIGGACYAF